MTGLPLIAVDVRYEQDVVTVRQRARQIAGLLGLTAQEQTAFATAVSEVVRNAFRYAGGGRVDFAVRPDGPTLVVRTADAGPGIANLTDVLNGRHVSLTGMRLGLLGAQRLCDEFDIDTAAGRGTTVTLGKHLTKRQTPLRPDAMAGVVEELARRGPLNPMEEVQEQNKELMLALDALRVRQAEVERLNAELAETNRGVVALYAELDDRAESLRRASEYKSRFLSDMTHELRTPLNAVISLSRLLLDRVDGELTAEQDKQVGFIHRSACALGDMVNDLLDLAKIEAGKIEVTIAPFQVADVLSALRGMFRPLAADGPVALVIEDADGLSQMYGDERKLTQILRNLVSNALKFTERGDVRVTAVAGPNDTAIFAVADTGIGIAPEHFTRIFEDFTQIDSGVQRRVRGTGLGLPLARKLAELLDGEIGLQSEVGVGTTFTVKVPIRLADATKPAPAPNAVPADPP